MRKTLISIAFFLVAGASGLYSQDITQPQFLGEVKVGNGEDQLGYRVASDTGAPPYPTVLLFQGKENLLILDRDRRIQIYEKIRLHYRNTISLRLPAVPRFVTARVYSDGTSFFCRGEVADFLLNGKFEIVRTFPAGDLKGDYFKYGFLWNFDENGLIEAFGVDGTRLKNPDAVKFIQSKNLDVYSNKKFPPIINASIRKLIESGRFLILDAMVFPKDFQQAKTFYQIFEGSKWRNHDKDLREKVPFDNEQEGYDSNWGMADDGSLVWKAPYPRNEYSVLSAYGDVLAYFSTEAIDPKLVASQGEDVDSIAPGLTIKMSPEGAVYLMAAYPDRVKFYAVREPK